jgi:hypothetical protein
MMNPQTKADDRSVVQWYSNVETPKVSSIDVVIFLAVEKKRERRLFKSS